MVAGRRDADVPVSLNQLSFTRDEFLALHKQILTAKAGDRLRMEGLEARRVDLIPAGSILLATAMDLFDFDAMTVSEWALREGIVLDVIGRHDPADWSADPRAIRRASVPGFGLRSGGSPSAAGARRDLAARRRSRPQSERRRRPCRRQHRAVAGDDPVAVRA